VRGIARIFYVSHAVSHAIYRYRNVFPEGFVREPKAAYVSRAYGPAVHNYAHAGTETVVPWNVRHVSPTYGLATYSYPGNDCLKPQG
jgi:hypothetical protein